LINAIIFDLGNTLIHEDKKRGNTYKKIPYAINVLTHLKKRYKLALITNVKPRSINRGKKATRSSSSPTVSSSWDTNLTLRNGRHCHKNTRSGGTPSPKSYH
jgi:hypothetical protein